MENKTKMIFLGPLNLNGSIKGGDQAKNRFTINEINPTQIIDTYNWKKRPLLWINILITLLTLRFTKRTILVSTSPDTGLLLIKLIVFWGGLKNKVFFQIIGNLTFKITKNKNIILLSRIDKVIVETLSMENLLIDLGLNNTFKIRNYKKFAKKQKR